MLLAADIKAVMLEKVNATDCRFFLAWAVVGVEAAAAMFFLNGFHHLMELMEVRE